MASGGAHRLRLLMRMGWYAPVAAVPRGPALARSEADVERWIEVLAPPVSRKWARLALIAERPEFRSLYYYRLRRAGGWRAAKAAVLGVIWPGERTLHLACSDIGGGLFIQHGFATIIAARSLGERCWVNQQVTIGFVRPDDRPVLGDGVAVYAGAKVLGDVTLGDGAVVGANAVVLEEVPAGWTAVGIPARLLPPKTDRV
ncbi:MAG: serine acetyltransferase [Actinomycetes bacterium]